MKKRYIYILLVGLMGLGLTTACNDKEFYDYVKASDKPSADEEPYTLSIGLKMSAENLARIDEISGTLSGMLLYTPSATTTRADSKTGSIDLKFTKGADGFTATFNAMGVDKSTKQILSVTLKHANGNVSTFTSDVSDNLSGLNHLEATDPIDLGLEEVTLPGGADDAVGGGSLNDWDNPTDVDGEAGSEINSANE
nr:hypothetical protein [uncultured Bacteroides sp.]